MKIIPTRLRIPNKATTTLNTGLDRVPEFKGSDAHGVCHLDRSPVQTAYKAPLQDPATSTRASLPIPATLNQATWLRSPEQIPICIVTQAGLSRVKSRNDCLPSADGYQRDKWTNKDRHENHTMGSLVPTAPSSRCGQAKSTEA